MVNAKQRLLEFHGLASMRQPGHGPEEQVDGRAAFEGKAGLPADLRETTQQ
jgi:hypothetical protein